MLNLKSKVARSLISHLMLHPESEMYINELSRRLDLDSGNLTRKLKELEQQGLLVSDLRGKQRYYSLNTKYPLLEEYRKIILKTLGVEKALLDTLNSVPKIHTAFIFGSYASDSMNAGSDIDLMVVGEHSIIELQKRLAKLQRSIDREINVVSIDREEFNRRKKSDTFLKNILKGKYIKLL